MITQSTTWYSMGTPYVIASDVTIMPNVTVAVEAGVRFEVFPNVGILVLGRLYLKVCHHAVTVSSPTACSSCPTYSHRTDQYILIN